MRPPGPRGMGRLAALLLTTAFLLALTGAAPGSARAGTRALSGLEPVACTELVQDLGRLPVSAAELECGYLPVPERRGAPGGRTIKLAVVVVMSTEESPRADPLFLAQGGPGVSESVLKLGTVPQVDRGSARLG